MHLVHDPDEMLEAALRLRREGKRIGVVPTMGYLHEGHLSLIRAARSECDHVITTVFVNPTQFGPSEDFERYPRDLRRDSRLAEEAGTDTLFAPEAESMYAPDHSTWVEVERLTDGLCGASRPGHFRGVTTVVTMLLNITQPDLAYFGRKDAQQAAVIRRMVRDLHFPCLVRVLPIVRDADGLALSSRNSYLSPDERRSALGLVHALRTAAESFSAGERDAIALCQVAASVIDDYPGLEPEYISLVHPDTMESIDRIDEKGLLALAARVGQTRLIDNALFVVGRPPEI